MSVYEPMAEWVFEDKFHRHSLLSLLFCFFLCCLIVPLSTSWVPGTGYKTLPTSKTQSSYLTFFLEHLSRSETAHLTPQIILHFKTFFKECFVEQKQIKSTTAACSKLWMFGGKTCHVVEQIVKAMKVENVRPY